MAAFVASDLNMQTGGATTLDTGNIAVTGSDLALVCGGGEVDNSSNSKTYTWDPAGNDESMTGTIATISQGTYLDTSMGYLDDPTTATAPVRLTFGASSTHGFVCGAAFSSAADIVAADFDSDQAASGTSLTATPGNVVSGDMVVDVSAIGVDNNMTVGADQTEREGAGQQYLHVQVSTQAGADGGEMSETFSGMGDGGIMIALRIPDAGAAAAGSTLKGYLHRTQIKTMLTR